MKLPKLHSLNTPQGSIGTRVPFFLPREQLLKKTDNLEGIINKPHVYDQGYSAKTLSSYVASKVLFIGKEPFKFPIREDFSSDVKNFINGIRGHYIIVHAIEKDSTGIQWILASSFTHQQCSLKYSLLNRQKDLINVSAAKISAKLDLLGNPRDQYIVNTSFVIPIGTQKDVLTSVYHFKNDYAQSWIMSSVNDIIVSNSINEDTIVRKLCVSNLSLLVQPNSILQVVDSVGSHQVFDIFSQKLKSNGFNELLDGHSIQEGQLRTLINDYKVKSALSGLKFQGNFMNSGIEHSNYPNLFEYHKSNQTHGFNSRASNFTKVKGQEEIKKGDNSLKANDGKNIKGIAVDFVKSKNNVCDVGETKFNNIDSKASYESLD